MAGHGTGRTDGKAISYRKLWRLLIDKGLTKTQLRDLAGISASTMAKPTKNGNVATETLLKICVALGCSIDDIL